MSLSLYIVDDEQGIQLLLSAVVKKGVPDIEILGCFGDGEEFLQVFEEKPSDIVFLDINMPNMSGIECAERICDVSPRTMIVFVTAHEGYMSKAFELYAFDYIIKPFKNDRVVASLKRMLSFYTALEERQEVLVKEHKPKKQISSGQTRIMVKNRDGTLLLNTSDIILVQRENRTTVLVTESEDYFSNETLADIEDRLGTENFFRCHKSYIVNLNKIYSITPYGRWTHILRLHGTKKDALITHEKLNELEQMHGLS